MAWKNTPARYGSVSIALHWLMLVLIAVVYLLMELKSIAPKGSAQRASMAQWHYTLGMTVFGLAWLRLLARLAGSTPQVRPALPQRPLRLSRLVHRVLYGLMLGLPLLGWLTLSAKGEPVPFYGSVLPALGAQSRSAAHWFKEFHEAGATLGCLLVGLHAAAALWHHFRRRDNTLRLMLPGA